MIVWTLGERLAKARRIAGIDRQEMADYLGLTTQAVGHYEGDRRTPKLGVLRLWALRCGVPLEWLQYGDTPPRPVVIAAAEPTPDEQPKHDSWYKHANGRELAAAA